MDSIDQQILDQLTKNAQKSFLKIAEEIGISPRTAQKRYAKMKENGLILRPTIIIDLSKLRYQGKAYLLITNKPDSDGAQIIKTLKRIHNIYFVASIAGEFDVLAMAPFKDFNDVIDIVNEIRGIPQVSQVEIALTSDTSFPVTKYYSKMPLKRPP
jgi:DNA-binding Lrp family transcriptional regulator